MQDYETSDLVGFVAVIGMAVRVPGANNLQDFWENLRRGVDSITHFTDEEMLYAGIPQRLLDDPNYVKANGRLPNIEMFDAGFFGINKRDAQITDPQHRIFLECAWEALESAGYDPFGFDGRIGVFASESLNSYFIQNLYTNRELLKTVGGIQMILGNDRDFLATRVSFLLNLRGPSIVLQSACSSSLSAVHLACQSLNNGESDMVLAGGVSINLPQNAGYLYHVGGIYSADGRCCAFDEKATGTVGGIGVGVVVLKRLEDALNDGDYVYSVIRGSAINNDGNAKVGYTAPSVQGQAEVIEEALAVGRVDASTITYVEAHGTGTTLGDPIEVEALTR
jgi:acyl transferase domain-containing protein